MAPYTSDGHSWPDRDDLPQDDDAVVHGLLLGALLGTLLWCAGGALFYFFVLQ